MSDLILHSWAETTVYPAGTSNSSKAPCDGDQCPVCEEPLSEGERVHLVTESIAADKWVHDSHIWKEGR